MSDFAVRAKKMAPSHMCEQSEDINSAETNQNVGRKRTSEQTNEWTDEQNKFILCKCGKI